MTPLNPKTIDDTLDVELLTDKPTLFYERLQRFLSREDADRVVKEVADICNYCWDAEFPCSCTNDE